MTPEDEIVLRRACSRAERAEAHLYKAWKGLYESVQAAVEDLPDEPHDALAILERALEKYR